MSTSVDAPAGAAAGRPATPAGPRAGTSAGTWQIVSVVARRELLSRLKDKAFIASSIFLLVVVAASVMLPLALADDDPPRLTVAVVGEDAQALTSAAAALGRESARQVEARGDDEDAPDPAAPPAEITLERVADVAAAEARLREGTADAAVVPLGSAPAGSAPAVQVLAASEVPGELRELVVAVATTSVLTDGLTGAGATPQQAQDLLRAAGTAAPAERLLDPPSEAARLAVPLSIAFAMLFFITVYLFGYAIAQSVVEEKQSRVVEILVAAVPIRLLLAGKVLGTTVLALGQLALLVAVGLAGASVAGQPGLVSVILRSGGWFLLFFLLGFLMLACLWAASGAVAGRQEDLQSTTVPLQFLVLVPFFAAVYVNTPGTPLTVLSYVPFTAPLAMPVRMMLGDAAWWEAALSAGILVLTAVGLVLLAARIYERALMRTGSRTSWAAALGLGRSTPLSGPRAR